MEEGYLGKDMAGETSYRVVNESATCSGHWRQDLFSSDLTDLLRTVPRSHLVLGHLDPTGDLCLEYVNPHTLTYRLPLFIHLEKNILQRHDQIHLL